MRDLKRIYVCPSCLFATATSGECPGEIKNGHALLGSYIEVESLVKRLEESLIELVENDEAKAHNLALQFVIELVKEK